MKEKAHTDGGQDYTAWIGVAMLVVSLIFVYRSFYSMRIPQDAKPAKGKH